MNDGLNQMRPEILEADGFIAGVPVFFETPSSDVMNLLQRAGIVSHAGDVDDVHLGMTFPDSTYRNIAFDQVPGTVAEAVATKVQTCS